MTLTHHDFRPDNLLFGTEEGADPVVVVDWQTVSPGLGTSDVSYLISGSIPDRAVRGEVEVDLVEEYRQRMEAAGVEVSARQMWTDYRYSSLYGLLITVIATVEAEQTERGDTMLAAMANRVGRQTIDLDALALVG